MSSAESLGVTTSAVINGVSATLVTVEVYRGNGIPMETIVGLAGTAVRESLDRIHGACRQSDLLLEPRRTTINLAPADHPKGGSGLDLPIALGMLVAEGLVPGERLAGCVCLGELQLDGTVRSVPGVLPAALAARDAGVRRLLVPELNVPEAAAVPGLEPIGVGSLREAVDWASGCSRPRLRLVEPPPPPHTGVDLSEIAGHAMARRAVEISAAGGHHLLMVGLPGSGKTMLARALPGVLPPLSHDEALETSAVYSVVGNLSGYGLLRRRPFRAPHHSVTAAGLIGGGVPLRPGEVSLAHHGVLFLDELPEFRRAVLESLRQPLEEARLSLVRGGRSVCMPARFQLVAAMNPCPCGQGAASDACRCGEGQLRAYWRRLSGPLLDRIDLVVGVEQPCLEALLAGDRAESSEAVRRRVTAARQVQVERERRFSQEAGTRGPDRAPGTVRATNAALPSRRLPEMCALSARQLKLARDQCRTLRISARGWHRVLRVARTLADLEQREAIDDADLAEAFQYRRQSADLAPSMA